MLARRRRTPFQSMRSSKSRHRSDLDRTMMVRDVEDVVDEEDAVVVEEVAEVLDVEDLEEDRRTGPVDIIKVSPPSRSTLLRSPHSANKLV